MKRTILFSLYLILALLIGQPNFVLANGWAKTKFRQVIIGSRPSLNDDEDKHKQSYKIKYGETMSGIAAKFGMRTADLLRLNKLKNADNIREGQAIWVIDQKKAAPVLSAAPFTKLAATSPNFLPASLTVMAIPASGQHTVQEGETLSKIAVRYGLKLGDLMSWNQLKSNLLQVNQKLALSEAANSPNLVSEAPKGSGIFVREKGMGEMISRVNVPMMVALHRKAPIGSVLRVYNPSSGAVVFAKVIGKLPDLDSEKKVMVKLSRSACRSIGIINEQFPIEITYEK